jgi:hypothetical protein
MFRRRRPLTVNHRCLYSPRLSSFPCNRGTQPPYVCSHTAGAPPEIRGLTKAREGDRRPVRPFWLRVTSSLSGDLPPPVSVELRNLEPKQGYNDTTDVALAVSFLVLGLRRLWVRYLSLIS